MGYRLNIAEITVTRGGKQTTYRRGDSVDGAHPSNLKQMVRLGQAVPDEEFVAIDNEPTPPKEPEPEKRPPHETAWQTTELSAIGLTDPVLAALSSAGLTTIADVLAFGAGHGTLTKIDGIGKASEKQIQQAIEKIAPKQ